jgi:hypothetical protein
MSAWPLTFDGIELSSIMLHIETKRLNALNQIKKAEAIMGLVTITGFRRRREKRPLLGAVFVLFAGLSPRSWTVR